MDTNIAAQINNFKLVGDAAYIEQDDPLGFSQFASILAELIQSSQESTPLTLGIHASWGMGKSSLMQQLKKSLKNRDETDISTVWFNAWTFEGQDIIEGLVKSVLNVLDPNVLRRALRNEKFTAAFKTIAGIASKLVGFDKLVDNMWQLVVDDPRARNQVQELLQNTMDEWIQKGPQTTGKRIVVVFIDDLDRCAPENVFQVFEAIKLYLDVKGIVFVVGIDSYIISDAILREKNYSKRISGSQYIEKVIQIDYNIPVATQEQIYNLFKMYANKSGTDKLFDEDGMQLVIDRSDSNPRRIKRFINSFILEHQLVPESNALSPALLVKIIMLGMYYRSFCRLFDVNSKIDLITEFLDYQDARSQLNGLSREGLDSISSENQDLLMKVFERYQLPRNMLGYSSGEAAQAVLDNRVPEEFPVLAAQTQFIKLLDSIVPDERLQVAQHIKRVVRSVEPKFAEESSKESMDYGPLDGLQILWIDDNPEKIESLMKDYLTRGAGVQHVTNSEEAIARLKADSPVDLIISDINRDEDIDAGFKAVEKFKELGFEGSVIFFTSKVRREDREKAKKLRANITNDNSQLNQWVQTQADRIMKMQSA